MDAQLASLAARAAVLWDAVPGSHIATKYIRNSYQNDPFRIVFELFLVFFAARYLMMARRAPGAEDAVKLTEREIDELIDDWSPEPLVPAEDDATAYAADAAELATVPVLTSAGGSKVRIEGTGNKLVTNLASFDVYGLAGSDHVKDRAVAALRKYGVGACNPPGFYGTMDVHMQLERDLAAFLGADQAILYAQGFSAIASVVPAFSKRGDLVVVDEAVAFSLQKGFQISRSKLVFFRHNDMHDLEHKLASIAAEDKRLRRPLYRKFILVEGLYANHGDIAPLPKLVELKDRFKYRLIVEESCSFGLLGKSGRGVTEHFGIPASRIDMIVGSLATAIGASGGFCAGSLPVIEHQRLSASAYVFSAALPPMLAVAASAGLAHIDKEHARVMPAMHANIKALRDTLKHVHYFDLVSADASPLQHIRIVRNTLPFTFTDSEDDGNSSGGADVASGQTTPPRTGMLSLLGGPGRSAASSSRTARSVQQKHSRQKKDPELARWELESQFLQDICKECLDNGVIITRAKYNVDQEFRLPAPSLKIIVPADLSRRDIEAAAKVVKNAAVKVVQAWAKARR